MNYDYAQGLLNSAGNAMKATLDEMVSEVNARSKSIRRPTIQTWYNLMLADQVSDKVFDLIGEKEKLAKVIDHITAHAVVIAHDGAEKQLERCDKLEEEIAAGKEIARNMDKLAYYADHQFRDKASVTEFAYTTFWNKNTTALLTILGITDPDDSEK